MRLNETTADGASFSVTISTIYKKTIPEKGFYSVAIINESG
jgi:hypothetical protein